MVIEIRPVHSNGYNCLEDVLATFSLWKNREYVLMFIKSWDFNFVPAEKDPGKTIGSRLSQGGDHCWDSIKMYHGMKIELIDESSDSYALNKAKAEISNGRPLLLEIDSFWIPWAETYQMQHMDHYLLAIGYDSNEKSIKCIDPFITKKLYTISENDLFKGKAKFSKLDFENENVESIGVGEIIRTAALWTRKNDENGITCFQKMRIFSDELEKSLDMKYELSEFKNEAIVPIYFSLYMIGSARLKLAKAIKYLAKKFELNELDQIAGKLEDLMWKWFEIRGSLMRAGRSKDYDMSFLRTDVAARVRELSVLEEQLSGKLLSISENRL